MKKTVMGISSGLAFLIFLSLACITNQISKSQVDQNVVSRWSDKKSVAQVSCFFSVNSGLDLDRIQEFEHSIDGALTEASVMIDSKNPGARLWVDAYSASGMVSISSDRASVSADAIGIGGDFFLFHPLKLLSGSYFSGNDVMTDYCLIDQDTAWQLFGSNDVAGQIVYISGIPHVVTGVVERPEGKLYRSAGLDGTCVYVSYATLSQYGLNHGINHYEILMPNPVTDFAYNYVKERLGTDEKETEIVENSRRYSLTERLKRLPEFDTRAMNGRAIIYPYWENVARGYEDILGVLTLLEMLALLIAVILGGLLSIVLWKNKGWTVKEKWLRLKDKLERRVERGREKRNSGKRIRKKIVYKQEFDSGLDEVQSKPENIWTDHNITDGIGKKNRENISDTIKQNEEDDWL